LALSRGDEAVEEQIGQGFNIWARANILIGFDIVKANMQAAEEDRLTKEELLGQVSSLTHPPRFV